MSTRAARGTKRTCQSNECGARFYDLNREPIACPICGTIYQIAHSTLPLAAVLAEEKAPRKPKKELTAEKDISDDSSSEDGDEALAEIEDAEDIPAEDDETFLEEEEEEGGDVSNIIGGPVDEGEEEI
jgi:uncharacterized protein (TIGR02300 family)